MLLLSSISNKGVLFIFSANKVAAEEVPLWAPLEQKVVKDVHRLNPAPTSTTSTQIESSLTKPEVWKENYFITNQ